LRHKFQHATNAGHKEGEDAKADLRHICRHGVRKYGEGQADLYYDALIERFEQLVLQPFLYQAFDDIYSGYRRSVCGVESIYYRPCGDTVEIMSMLGQQDLRAVMPVS
jgi:toxin ParE1/3/4